MQVSSLTAYRLERCVDGKWPGEATEHPVALELWQYTSGSFHRIGPASVTPLQASPGRCAFLKQLESAAGGEVAEAAVLAEGSGKVLTGQDMLQHLAQHADQESAHPQK